MLSSVLKVCLPRRNIHTSVSFQFVKDVYKVIDYNAPFSRTEKENIVEKLNTFTEKDFHLYTSKKFSKTIIDYRNGYGQIDCVERLLDLEKVEKITIEKLCENILQNPNIDTLKEQSGNIPAQKLDKMMFRNIHPKPDVKTCESFQVQDPTYVGIHLTLQGLSYSMKGSSNALLDWNILDLPEVEVDTSGKNPKIVSPTTNAYYDHTNLYSSCLEIVSKIPEADYYILEEPLPFLQKDPYLKSKINLLKMRTTLMTILMHQNKKIYTMKPNVVDALFKLKVGNERISAQSLFDLRDDSERIPVSSNKAIEDLFIEDHLKKKYHGCSNVGKEYLLISFLKTVAFDYLCKEAVKGFKV